MTALHWLTPGSLFIFSSCLSDMFIQSSDTYWAAWYSIKSTNYWFRLGILQAVWLWANHLISWMLSFFICTMRLKILGFYEDFLWRLNEIMYIKYLKGPGFEQALVLIHFSPINFPPTPSNLHSPVSPDTNNALKRVMMPRKYIMEWYKVTSIRKCLRGKEYWEERFNSSEEVRAGFIDVVIFGWTLENGCVSKWAWSFRGKKYGSEVRKEVKWIMGTLMSRLLLWEASIGKYQLPISHCCGVLTPWYFRLFLCIG